MILASKSFRTCPILLIFHASRPQTTILSIFFPCSASQTSRFLQFPYPSLSVPSCCPTIHHAVSILFVHFVRAPWTFAHRASLRCWNFHPRGHHSDCRGAIHWIPWWSGYNTVFKKKLRIYLEYALKNLTSAKGKSSETWSGRLQLSQIAQNLRMFTLKLSPGILSRNSAKMCETVKKSWAESGPSPGVLTELRPQLLHLLVASLNLLEPEPGSVKNFLTRIHPLKQGKRKQGSKLMC